MAKAVAEGSFYAKVTFFYHNYLDSTCFSKIEHISKIQNGRSKMRDSSRSFLTINDVIMT